MTCAFGRAEDLISSKSFVVLVGLAALGCGPSLDPAGAFDAFALALEQGDRPAALSHVTQQTREALDALWVVDGRAGTARLSLGGPAGLRPTRATAVVGALGPDVSIVAVQVDGPGDDDERAEVLLRLEDGEWRVDLVLTESVLWSRDWSRSGSTRRAPPNWLDLPLLEPSGGD